MASAQPMVTVYLERLKSSPAQARNRELAASLLSNPDAPGRDTKAVPVSIADIPEMIEGRVYRRGIRIGVLGGINRKTPISRLGLSGDNLARLHSQGG